MGIMTFNEIKSSRKVSGVCEKCGKRRTRTITESQTRNPFNKNKEGFIKSHVEIEREVIEMVAKRIACLQENFICASCI